jgi:hypothetical protein
MKNFFKKIKKKHFIFTLVFLCLFVFIFLLVSPVEAQFVQRIGNFVTTLVGWLFALVISMMGLFLMLLIRVLVYVASIQSFIDVAAVTLGWSMVRDLANMFFIVILLIIAFATILRIEKYNYKKWLPKLILMAVLINYSKMICGVLIDIAQVIMLSFVNSFKSIGGTNVTTMLGIRDWQKFGGGGTMDQVGIGNWEIVAGYFLAFIYVVVSIVVIGTMIMVLVMRIVMIWIYVVLSPLAFLLSSFPGGEGYAQKWWTQFTQNLVVGPVLAFFIWLSFTVVSPTTQGTAVFGENSPRFEPGSDEMMSDDFGKGDLMIQFIVSIGLLIGGLKVSQEIGGAAGSLAGKGMARLNKMSLAAQKGAVGAGKATGKFAGRQALGGSSWLAQKTGKRFGSKRLEKIGDIGQAWRGDIRSSRKKDKVEKREKFLKSMGMGEKAGDIISTSLKEKGLHKRYETMYEATEGMGRKPRVARDLAKHFENPRYVQDFSSSDLYTLGSGVNKENAKAMFNNPEAIKTFEQWFKREGQFAKGGELEELAYSGDAKDLSKARAWRSGIKDAEEKGVKGVENTKGIKNALEELKLDTATPVRTFEKLAKDTKSTEKKDSKKGGLKYNYGDSSQPNNLADNLQSSNVNQGKLFTNSFASGKEVMGIDFAKLQTEGVKIDTRAEGVNANKESMGDNIKPVAEALINQLSQAQINLDADLKVLDEWKESGEITDDEYKKERAVYEKEANNLDKAKNRIQEGDFENINLINTAHPKFGREMALRNSYHEEVHAAGLEDEYLTKTIENSLMNNKLYGRNPETGNRHAFEVAKTAVDLKKAGKNDQEIVKTVDQEIKKRSKNEASSRADRVLKLEKGELKTESQVIASTSKPKKIEKKDSMVDIARERSLISSQKEYYRKMISEGSKKDKNGKYDENKVKIGEEGIKKMEELSRSLNRLDSLKQDQSRVKEKINTHRQNIKEAEKTGNEGLVIKHENNLRGAEKEQKRINDQIIVAKKEISNKSENIKKDIKIDVNKEEKIDLKQGPKGEVKMNLDYDTSKLENIVNEFSNKLKNDLSSLDKKDKKSPLIVKQGGAGKNIDQVKLLRLIGKAIKGGNQGVVKLVNNYNKANQQVTKNIILDELSELSEKLEK